SSCRCRPRPSAARSRRARRSRRAGARARRGDGRSDRGSVDPASWRTAPPPGRRPRGRSGLRRGTPTTGTDFPGASGLPLRGGILVDFSGNHRPVSSVTPGAEEVTPMARKRSAVVVVPLVLLAAAVSACMRASTGPTGAAQIEAQLPPPAPAESYVGAQLCRACHPAIAATFAQTPMGRLFLNAPRNAKEAHVCETCHGPGKAHMEAGGGRGKGGLITFARNDPTPVGVRNAICLECHAKGDRLFWKGSAHAKRDVACTNGHRVMGNTRPRHNRGKGKESEPCGTCHLQKRAQQMRSSHMPIREGKMSCSSCHNPHGTVSQALLKENTPNDTCYT